MSGALYQFLLLGSPTSDQVGELNTTIVDSLKHFDLHPDVDFTVATGISPAFDELMPAVAVFFGGSGADLPEYRELARLSVPVIPVVSSTRNVSAELPECLRPINAIAIDPVDLNLIGIANAALQCLGLLPMQRRVFLSYYRDESRDVAIQLFEQLAAKNFDVFLDTHSVGTGVDFQAMLWHRLCDSDVVVMLDTPGYFQRRWTKQEWGRAIDKHISILQVVWPRHTPSRFTKLATPVELEDADFVGSRLVDAAIDRIALGVERIRSKSIAIRHANIAGALQMAIEDIGGTIEGFGQRRSMVLKLPSGVPLVVYPSVGVPTAVTVHEALLDGDSRLAAVVYDHVGLSEQYQKHLGWLSQNMKNVKWLRTRQVGWDLAELTEL